jgi:hypothetical protein
MSGSLSSFFEISLVCTRDIEESGDHGSGVFTAEETDRVGEKESGDTTAVDVQTLLEVSLEHFQTWDYFPQLRKYSRILLIWYSQDRTCAGY